MMDVNWTYCGDHFTIYANRTIMLYTLNIYSDVCQLFLNKTGEKMLELQRKRDRHADRETETGRLPRQWVTQDFTQWESATGRICPASSDSCPFSSATHSGE